MQLFRAKIIHTTAIFPVIFSCTSICLSVIHYSAGDYDTSVQVLLDGINDIFQPGTPDMVFMAPPYTLPPHLICCSLLTFALWGLYSFSKAIFHLQFLCQPWVMYFQYQEIR